ncbi:Ankyrin repeat family protein [Hirschfeldia incana]|nr:Ankyrin repeat family protein [Hirschfeldia incana]
MDAFETHQPREIVTHPLHNSFNPRSEDYFVAGKFPRQRSSVFDLDKEGLTPLHVAAGAGQVDTVRAILGIDKKLCRLKGRDGKTPLHVAVTRGKIDVIREIVSSCVDCLEDETIQGQTALHLAVMHQEIGAVVAIVELITETNRIEVLYKKDEQGNTPLHLATWRKNRQVIEVLVEAIPEESRTFEVNAMNKMGLSALDLLVMFPSEAGDREIYEKLIEAGAQRGRDIGGTTNVQRTTSSTSTCRERSMESQSHKDLVKYFTFKKHRDSPSEARSALLVVASLVATATFQASLTPPGGTWQDSYIPDVSNNATSVVDTPAQLTHIAGQSIMGTFNGIAFTLFVFFNTIGFSVSLSMINILTLGFPLRFQLQICMMAMYFSHNTAMTSVAPDHVKLYCVLITSILAAATPALMRFLEKPIGMLCQLWDSMLHKICCQ